MTVVKSQSFCGGQNGLTILAKIICNSVENIFDHLVRPFWPIFFWESFEFFVATMVNGTLLPEPIKHANNKSRSGSVMCTVYHYTLSDILLLTYCYNGVL